MRPIVTPTAPPISDPPALVTVAGCAPAVHLSAADAVVRVGLGVDRIRRSPLLVLGPSLVHIGAASTEVDLQATAFKFVPPFPPMLGTQMDGSASPAFPPLTTVAFCYIRPLSTVHPQAAQDLHQPGLRRPLAAPWSHELGSARPRRGTYSGARLR